MAGARVYNSHTPIQTRWNSLRERFGRCLDTQTRRYSHAASKLLQFIGMRIHATQSSHLAPLSIAGSNNTMAAIVLPAFKNGEYFTAKANLTKYFNTTYPLPQNLSWHEYTLLTKLISRVLSCLLGEQSTMRSSTRGSKRAKEKDQYRPAIIVLSVKA